MESEKQKVAPQQSQPIATMDRTAKMWPWNVLRGDGYLSLPRPPGRPIQPG